MNLYTPKQFRDDLVQVAIDGYNDMYDKIELRKLQDLIDNIDDEKVHEEFVWSAGNVIDNIIGTYLKHKEILVNYYGPYAPTSSFNAWIDRESIVAKTTVEYTDELIGYKNIKISAEYVLPFYKFDDDEFIQEIIDRIGEQVDEQLMKHNIIEETEYHTVLIYSLDDCSFYLFESSIGQEEVLEILKEYRKDGGSIHDFIDWMNDKEDIHWVEQGVDTIDFDWSE